LTESAPVAVYVHWPYCARICPYCDFNVVRDRGQTEQAALAAAIVADLAGQAALIGPRRLESIFLGGGTPSLMQPDWAAQIIETAQRLWPGPSDVEITLEANPTDAEAARFAAFAQAGVNRLSLGLQSLDDAALAFLGRNHDAAEAIRAAETARVAFPRLSLDLIYARPGQTVAAWENELSAAIALGAEHISPYQLTIEAGTAFDRQVQRGAFVPAAGDDAAALFETTQALLEGAGFEAYEVSNHARGAAGRSVHNLAYWRGHDYVGAGPGAHGRLATDAGRLSTTGVRQVRDYIAAVGRNGVGFETSEILSPREAAIERLLLGLRSVEGIPRSDLRAVDLDEAALNAFAADGLLIANERITATARGRMVLDRLIADLIA